MYLFRQIDFYILAGFLFVASSCTPKTDSISSVYYPVNSLIRAQAYQLVELNASLTKHAQINGAEETTLYTPADTSAWLKELDIFTSLNSINKPVNAGNYEVTDGTDDQKTNLKVRTFTSRNSLPVVWLKVYYLNTPENVLRLEALYREESSLMKGSRMLIMEFQELNNKTILASYSIEGGQEMFLGSPVEFSITGSISSTSWHEANTNL